MHSGFKVTKSRPCALLLPCSTEASASWAVFSVVQEIRQPGQDWAIQAGWARKTNPAAAGSVIATQDASGVLLAATGHEADQAKAGHQHAVGLGFGNGGGDRIIELRA